MTFPETKQNITSVKNRNKAATSAWLQQSQCRVRNYDEESGTGTGWDEPMKGK